MIICFLLFLFHLLNNTFSCLKNNFIAIHLINRIINVNNNEHKVNNNELDEKLLKQY